MRAERQIGATLCAQTIVQRAVSQPPPATCGDLEDVVDDPGHPVMALEFGALRAS